MTLHSRRPLDSSSVNRLVDFVERLAQLGNKDGRLARSLSRVDAKVEKAKHRSEHRQLHDPKARAHMPEEVLAFGNS